MSRYTSKHTGSEIDVAIDRAKSGGTIDTLLAKKAPAGYGLGEEYATRVNNTNLDTLKNGGTYYIGTGCTNTPPNVDPAWSTLHVIPGRACTQIYIPANDAGRPETFSSWIARIYNDKTAAWRAWEWVNPPMALNVEYRTTERYGGKPVYVKLVDCGNVASGAKTINFGYSDSQAFIISVHGVMKSSSGKSFAVPRNNGTDVVSCHSDGSGIVVWSKTSAYESYTINCLVKYTKTTD